MKTEESKRSSRLQMKLALVLVALAILTLVLTFYLHMRFVDILFVEGLAIFVVGAYIASGMGNPGSVTVGTTTADPEFYREWLKDQRSKQMTEGTILIAIGAILMVLAVVIGVSVGPF